MSTYILCNIGDEWPFQIDFDVKDVVESEHWRSCVEIGVVFVLEKSHIALEASDFRLERLSSEEKRFRKGLWSLILGAYFKLS